MTMVKRAIDHKPLDQRTVDLNSNSKKGVNNIILLNSQHGKCAKAY